MSGSGLSPLGQVAANYGALGTVIANAGSVRTTLDTLTEQVSSGKVATSYAGLGSGAATSLVLDPALAAQQTWSANIDAVSGQMQVAQTALSQISAIAANFYAQTNNLNDVNPSEIDTVAASAQTALQQMAGLLDTTDGSVYVFAGQDSQEPPVPDPGDITASGFMTQISAAVAGLSANGAAATVASTLAVAGSNAAGTSPFSAVLSQPAAALAGLRSTVQTGDGQYVPTGILASANAAVASTGSSTTGSYIRDILRGLATIGSLSSSQAGDTGFSALVTDTNNSLSAAVTALNSDAGVMGNQQAQLTATQTQIADVTTSLQSQVSGAEDVDMAATLSQLSLVQTQLQSSYQIIAGMEGLSLAKFLPV